jgi:formylglycine-generating enzyme required for sulfatase activity
MVGKIFVNYRRNDDPGFTQALYLRLETEFDVGNLFMDVEGHIKPGDDFVEVLREQVAQCDVLLVVIGPRWAELMGQRAEDQDDFVAIEIKAALDLSKRVIPVLVGGASMPRATMLPEHIRALARHNAVVVRPERFKADCQGLIDTLKEQLAAAERDRTARAEALRAPPDVAPRAPDNEQLSATFAPLSLEREQALQVGESFKEGVHCPWMVVLPPGEIIMGSPADERGHTDLEGPQHRVAFTRPFAVGRFAVTFEEWDACVAAGGGGRYRPKDEGWGRGRRPVININWDDAQQFIAWLYRTTGKPYRLLSEAEWEYAARAGTQTTYFWGNEIGKGNANCNGCGSQWDNRQSAPVGSFPANAFGLYDMHGNVWEWVEDCWHDGYKGAPSDGSAWVSGDSQHRVLRGGSWFNIPQGLRSAYRYKYSVANRFHLIGFRVARTLSVAPRVLNVAPGTT